MPPVTTPIPLAPANGAVLAQPQSPPLLQWSSSQGAVSYTIEVDGDSDLLGAKIYTARPRRFVVTDPLTIGDWYWRVTANKDAGLTSLPSAVTRFDIQAARGPADHLPGQRRQPGRSRTSCSTGRRCPARGPTTCRWRSTHGFNNITYNVTNVWARAISPPTTLANDQFWWRVRAVDLAGQPTPWTDVASTDSSASGPTSRSRCTRPANAPAPDRTVLSSGRPCSTRRYYELDVATNANMTRQLAACARSCGHDVRAAREPATAASHRAATYWWEVRPMDDALPRHGLPGILSSRRPSTGPTRRRSGCGINLNAAVTDLKVAVDGTGIAQRRQRLQGPVADPNVSFICTGVPTTPVFSWDPGARRHVVPPLRRPGRELHHQRDEHTASRRSTRWSRWDRATSKQHPAGEPGRLGVLLARDRACGTQRLHDASPVSQNPPLPGSKAFRKASPGVAGLSTSRPQRQRDHLLWQDYYDTNPATSWNGERATRPRAPTASRSPPTRRSRRSLDTATVDQTTYTASDRLYPDGTLLLAGPGHRRRTTSA